MKKINLLVCFIALCFSFSFSQSFAQDGKSSFEVYGFTMAEAGYNINTINPNWYDAMRVTRLPSNSREFLPEGKVFFSVRQSKFGVKSSIPTSLGNFTTQFDFDLFGVGKDEGQTTIRLRNAWGTLGKFGAGQTNSVFMDGDVFPNSLEYWGPTGMIFFRNIQVRFSPMMDKQNTLAFALENPGASGDGGIYSGRNELQFVEPQFNVPDFTGHYRYTGNWGYVQVGGIVGSLKWVNTDTAATIQLNGSAVRWGGTISTNIKIGKSATFRGQYVYGEGMENYMNDAPVDVGVTTNYDSAGPGMLPQPIKGKALPVWGATAFVDITWSKLFSSTVGYSVETIRNSDLQAPSAFKQGQYGLVNVLYYPVANMMAGVEYNFGRRDNYKDNFHSIGNMIRFGFRYNFSRVFTF